MVPKQGIDFQVALIRAVIGIQVGMLSLNVSFEIIRIFQVENVQVTRRQFKLLEFVLVFCLDSKIAKVTDMTVMVIKVTTGKLQELYQNDSFSKSAKLTCVPLCNWRQYCPQKVELLLPTLILLWTYFVQISVGKVSTIVKRLVVSLSK